MLRLVVLFDGGCPMCRGTVRVLRRLDWLQRLAYADVTQPGVLARHAPGLSDADALLEMYVVDQQGRRFAGFEGYLRIALVVPVMWPLALLGRVRGFRQLGHKVYRMVAANRARHGRCTDDVCAPATPSRRS